MIYRLENGLLTPCEGADPPVGDKGKYVGVFAADAKNAPSFPAAPLPERLLETVLSSDMPRFVSQEKLDILCVPVDAGEKKNLIHPTPIYLFLQQNSLQFFCSDPALPGRMLEQIRLDGSLDNGLGEVVCEFFRRLLSKDGVYLEELEQGINRLEDEVLERKQKNYTKRFSLLRKRLMVLSHYYEQLMDIFDGIELNENGFFERHSLKQLKIADGKAGRLYQNVQHLRDYVTQVREAYQSEVDISLNRTMKLFTVLTAIFLPLTLLAGWYGMNFDMPEYHSPYGYPALIVVCVLLVVGTIAAFKRNKWF